MLNLIRMNLFRMFHTKSVIVVFCLLMGFSILNGCTSVYDKEHMQKLINGQSVDNIQEQYQELEMEGQEEETGNFAGIYIDTPVNNNGILMDYIYTYCEEISSGIVLLFILIGAVLFFWGDEKSGFLKNIAGQIKHRYNIFFSKLVVIAIYTFVCMVCYMVAEFVAYKCSWLIGVNINLGLKYIPEVFNINFGIEHIPEALEFFALEYLLYMAFISGLLFITEITKSTAVSIIIGMLGLFGFGIFFSSLVQKIFNTDFNIAKYYINTNISNLYLGMDWHTINYALGIGIEFFVIYNVLSVLWFSRKDIV